MCLCEAVHGLEGLARIIKVLDMNPAGVCWEVSKVASAENGSPEYLPSERWQVAAMAGHLKDCPTSVSKALTSLRSGF